VSSAVRHRLTFGEVRALSASSQGVILMHSTKPFEAVKSQLNLWASDLNRLMAFSADNLLRQLDQPEIIDWALELKHRNEAYIFLMQAVRSGQLNVNQTRNALHALFRIAYHEHGHEALQTFVEFANHGNQVIRSEAVQLAIGLVRWASKWERAPLVLSDEQATVLRSAVARGLTPKVTELAREFLVNGKQ
jgi:hypothetical protein